MSLIERICTLVTKDVRAAILMSGGWSNARVILDNKERYPNIHIGCIVSDTMESKGEVIAKEYGLNYMHVDRDAYPTRKDFFSVLLVYLQSHGIEFLLYAGFMRIASWFFVETIPGINSHPSDLTLCDAQGIPKYRGMDALESMRKYESYVTSSVHVVDTKVDSGFVISTGKQIDVQGTKGLSAEELHNIIKSESEHHMYRKTLACLSGWCVQNKSLPPDADDVEHLFATYLCQK